MVETRSKLLARLKKQRKKAGIGEFRKKKTLNRRKPNNRVMVRRRKTRVRRGRNVVRKSRSRSGKSMTILGFNIEKLLFLGGGAGIAGVVGAKAEQIIKPAFPNSQFVQKLGSNAFQGLGAVALKMGGKALGVSRFTNKLADGMLIKTVGDFVEDNVASQLLKRNSADVKSGSGFQEA